MPHEPSDDAAWPADWRLAEVPTERLTPEQRADILALCERAYGEDLTAYLAAVGEGRHLLAAAGGRLLGHAMWVERRLEAEGIGPLRTAYVELVATAPEFQGKGVAGELMRQLVRRVRDYELAALSRAETSLYARLGWQPWEGALFVRRGGRLEPTAGEAIMVMALPGTPSGLDLTGSLSVEWRAGEIW